MLVFVTVNVVICYDSNRESVRAANVAVAMGGVGRDS